MKTEPEPQSSFDDSSGQRVGSKTRREEILKVPDVYIGSVGKRTQKLWVHECDSLRHREVTFVPGLYKIFDEILIYAAGNKQHDPAMDSLHVEIDASQCRISVYYNGDGIPVEVHGEEEGVYMPEMVFGRLSNCDPNVKDVAGGRSSYGVKLANIFSTEFIVEIADSHREKTYKQVFSENMGKKSEPQVRLSLTGVNWTRVTFKPDLAKFSMTHLEDDVVALMRRRVCDIAGIVGQTVQVALNGQRLKFLNFTNYVNYYLWAASMSPSRNRREIMPRIYEKINDQLEVCLSLSEGEFEQISFVNKAATTEGGTHVDYVSNEIVAQVVSYLNKKGWRPNTEEHEVKRHLWIFINAHVDNPTFSSPTKEALISPLGNNGSRCELSDLFLDQVFNSHLVRRLLPWSGLESKQKHHLRKQSGSKQDRQKLGLK